MRLTIVAALVIAAFVPRASHAQLESNCGPYSIFKENLLEKYSETVIARGLGSSGKTLYEVYKSPTGTTWTFIVVQPSGKACFIASGQHFLIDTVPAILKPKTKETIEHLCIDAAR